MNWTRTALALSDCLSIALVFRLFTLRLHRVYRVFCGFLVFEAISTSFIMFERFSSLDKNLDYRVLWLLLRLVYWILSISMVYALLQALLQSLPGILRLSRRVLSVVLALAGVIALLSAGPEYIALGVSRTAVLIDHLVGIALILERLISTVAVLTLLLMLLFVLWYPVRMPRNLAVFSLGFCVYFTSKTMFLLLHSFWSHKALPIVNIGVTFIFCICLVYWIIFLNRRGEIAPVVMGHSWQADRQLELMNDLEHINEALTEANVR